MTYRPQPYTIEPPPDATEASLATLAEKIEANFRALFSDNEVLAGSAATLPIDLTSSSSVTGRLPYANQPQVAGLSVLGNATNATANEAAITAGSDKQVLRRSGTAVAFGAVDLSSSAAVTGDLPYANLVQATAASKLVGRGSASGAGDFEEITIGSNLTMTGTTLSAASGGTYTEQASTVTGAQNNFSLSAAFTYLKWNGASAATFSGFTVGGSAPSAGSMVMIENITSGIKMTLANESALSTAANRFTWPEGIDVVIGPGTRVLLNYDTVTSRWRAQAIDRPQWAQGPWLLDPNSGSIAKMLSTDTSGTFNDYNPTGFDSAVMMEFEPASGVVTLNGLIAPTKTRILIIGNRDSGTGTVVLKHQNAGSSAANRFRLPGNIDCTLAAGEYAWLYYDLSAARWRMMVTAQSAGGVTAGVVNAAIKVYKATVKLTHAQILTLQSVPVQIVAAPGAGFHIDVISASFLKDTTAGAYVAASSGLNLTWGSAGVVSAVTALGWSPTAASKVWGKFVTTTNTSTSASNIQNKGIFAQNNSVDPTSGNAANYLTIAVVYAIIDETSAT